MLPSRPDLGGPISLTVVDDQFAYATCFVGDVEASYIYMGVEAVQDGETLKATLLSGESSDQDTITIASGQTLIASELPRGLRLIEQELVSAKDILNASTKAYISISGPDLLVEMAFDDVDIAALRNGRYQYHSGEISDEPCGMDD